MLRQWIRSERGAVDLPSIIVGVIVMGILSGVVAASVFLVIPGFQNNTAKSALEEVKTAQAAYLLDQPRTGQEPSRANLNDLKTKMKLDLGLNMRVVTDTNKTCWVAVVTSDTGKNFYLEEGMKAPEPYSPATTTFTCQATL